jgi:signal transduction histidine kinase
MCRMNANGEDLARLQALAQEQAALRRVATLVASDAEPQEVFARVCAEVGVVLGVEGTNLTRFESDGTQTVLAGWSTHGAPIFPTGPGVPLSGEAAVPKVARTGRPQRVDDYAEVEGELADMIRAAGIASAVAAPITVAGRLWGAIVATTSTPRGFAPGTEDRIAGFAELVADALANADAREQLATSRARLVEAADSERRRLERNLHDGAQQRLVSVALDLGRLEAHLEDDPAAAKRQLEAVREELELALEELRELARGIHPAVLSDRGLAPALDALAVRAPMPVEISGLPARRLPAPVESAVYYFVAEALTNAVKHARASTVKVRFGAGEDSLGVEVVDDGIGGADWRIGTGLRGLVDRIDALGGRLRIKSPPGGGTRLEAEIPLEFSA